MTDPITAANPNLKRVPDSEDNPYQCPDGWYRTKGHPKTRIAGSARVYDSAQVCGSARVCGSALVGNAVYAFAIKWPASLCAKGTVIVGCQQHPITEWLKTGKSLIPWDAHCTKAEKKIIQDIIRTFAAQEKLGNTWAKDSK